MAIELEYLRSNLNICYPFIEDDNSSTIKSLFADMYVLSTVDGTENQRLHMVNFDPTTSPPQILLKWEDGTTFIDSTADASMVFHSYTFDIFTLFEWRLVAPVSRFFTGNEYVVRLTANTSLLQHVTTSVSIVPSLIELQSGMVRKIALETVTDGLPDSCCSKFLQGSIVLQAGYNMQLSQVNNNNAPGIFASTTPVRKTNSFQFAAISGAGDGQAPGCETAPATIKTINTVTPDASGNFKLLGDACLWWTPVASGGYTPNPDHPFTDYIPASLADASLKLVGSCKACCDCSDYETAYADLAKVWGQAKTVAAQIASLINQYNALCEEWKNSSYCTNQKRLNVSCNIIARPDFHVAVGALVINRGSTPALITLTFTNSPATGTMEYGSGRLTIGDIVTLGGSDTGTSFLAPPGEQVRYSYEMRWNSGSNRVGLPITVTATATGIIDNVSVTESSVASAALLGPLELS